MYTVYNRHDRHKLDQFECFLNIWLKIWRPSTRNKKVGANKTKKKKRIKERKDIAKKKERAAEI